MTISPWLWPLPVLAVLALAFIYSRRKEQERHLLWKLLGYLLLGAFMLRLNGFPLPLGYALFLLLLQAKPKPNRAAKHSAAFAGLLLFSWRLPCRQPSRAGSNASAAIRWRRPRSRSCPCRMTGSGSREKTPRAPRIGWSASSSSMTGAER